MPYKKRHIPWNKGLTKETDERIVRASENMHGKKRSELGRLNNSIAQKKRYRNDPKHQFRRSARPDVEERRRQALIGHKVSKNTRKKLSLFRIGKSWEELLGKEKAQQAKNKISKALTGRCTWQTGLTKETHPSLKKHSDRMKVLMNGRVPEGLIKWRKENPERLRKIARNNLKKYMLEHPEHQKKAFAKLLEKNPNHQREASIKSCLKQNGFTSSIEKRLKQYLIENNIEFKKQVELLGICVVDFYIPKNKTPVFCDGCYWHSCPEHKPNGKGSRQHDEFITSKLVEHGFNPIRIWEHEINNNDFSKLEGLS